jgi:hypothetical protein
MDPATMIVAALVAGSVAGVSTVSSTAIADAYQGLKSLVIGKLKAKGMTHSASERLVSNAIEASAGRRALAERLADAELDPELLRSAQDLFGALRARADTFIVDASQARGVIVGDQATQHNTFN